MTLQDLITLHEGLRRKPYRCPAGKLTIGVGHNIETRALPVDIDIYLKTQGEITDEMVERLLVVDIESAQGSCRKWLDNWDQIDTARQMAITDFMFNVGPGTAKEFVATQAAIELGDWEAAAHCLEDSRWYRQVGKRGERIVQIIRTGVMA